MLGLMPGLCECGCGAEVRRRFLPGHDRIRRTPGCGKPGHDTDYLVTRSTGRILKRCHECLKESNRRVANARHARRRQAALDRYGRICACCGEANTVFLAVDHVNGGGNNHRRVMGITGSASFYRWLDNNGWPDGFQTLCHNCNYAKHALGVCPHVAEGGDADALLNQQPVA